MILGLSDTEKKFKTAMDTAGCRHDSGQQLA